MTDDNRHPDHAPEKWLGIVEIVIGLFFVANFELTNIIFGGPILAAGAYTYMNRGRNYRNYRRVQAALGLFLLAYFIVFMAMLWGVAA